MTVGWGGMGIIWQLPVATCYVRPQRYTYDFTEKSDYFTLSAFDLDYREQMLLMGTKSGRDMDKAAETGLRYMPAEQMRFAPAVEGAPVSLSCRVKQVLELGSHDMFIGEVVSVMIRQDLLDEKGSLHLEKAGLIAYSHGLYQKLGDVIGFFGWSVAREDVFRRRMSDYR